MIAQNETKVQGGLANKTGNSTVSDKHCKTEDFSTKQIMVTVRLFDTREWVWKTPDKFMQLVN